MSETLESYARDDRLQTKGTQAEIATNVGVGKYAIRMACILASPENRARQLTPAYWTLRRVKGPLAPGFGLPFYEHQIVKGLF